MPDTSLNEPRHKSIRGYEQHARNVGRAVRRHDKMIYLVVKIDSFVPALSYLRNRF